MDHVQHLRERAAEFENLAVTTTDALAALNFHQLAILCRESADQLARRADSTRAASRPTP
jgi:hypothetical protein